MSEHDEVVRDLEATLEEIFGEDVQTTEPSISRDIDDEDIPVIFAG